MESSSGTSNKSKRSTKLDVSQPSDAANGADGRFSSKGPSSGKRMKKDDSGINIVPESDTSDDNSDCVVNNSCESIVLENTKSACNQSEPNSPDSGNLESSSFTEIEQQDLTEKVETVVENGDAKEQSLAKSEKTETSIEKRMEEEKVADNSESDCEKYLTRSSLSKRVSDKDPDDSHDDDENIALEASEDRYDPTPSKRRPVHKWHATKSVISRQYGSSLNYSPDLFRYDCYGSLHMVERLELMYKMKKHDGCVNALHFNTSGTKLATGSDDLNIIIWDWTTSVPLSQYNSGHRSNVFQAKFMPLIDDCHIVSCARDGQVRLGEISSDGVCRDTRKIAQHRGAAHKLAIQMDSAHTFLSCGEDAAVFGIDLRKEKPDKLVVCKENEKKVPLYSIFINPFKPYEYIVGGRHQYVKVYDTRFLSQSDGYVKQFCPSHLVSNEGKANVTSVVYNYNGTEILASYNDEDIYIFDSLESDSSKFMHKYSGHRNSQTVKGVNYFGSKSEYIVSGSDCGYIFFWEKTSEHIVKYMYGDEGGVVNCLEPNPNMPVLATSGLDDDIKIWVPSCEEPPNLGNLRKHLISNMKEREEDSQRDCDGAFVNQTIWFLMQHLARARARRRPVLWSDMGDDPVTSNSSSSDSETQDDESEFRNAIQCNQS